MSDTYTYYESATEKTSKPVKRNANKLFADDCYRFREPKVGYVYVSECNSSDKDQSEILDNETAIAKSLGVQYILQNLQVGQYRYRTETERDDPEDGEGDDEYDEGDDAGFETIEAYTRRILLVHKDDVSRFADAYDAKFGETTDMRTVRKQASA